MSAVYRLKCLAVRVARLSPLLRCSDCERLFWRFDDRAFVSGDARYGVSCATCSLFSSGGGDAWAVFNDCQGVFSDMVFRTQAEAAIAAAEPDCVECECYVAPVQVLREPEWRIPLRRVQEREFSRCESGT